MIEKLPPKSFCLIRHGETTANRDCTIAGRLDVALTDTGRAQARALSSFYWRQEYQLFSSPLERAVETCTLGFPDKAFRVVPELRERDWGVHEGRPLTELPAREGRPDKGEDWADMIDRVAGAIHECCNRANERLPILICHSGVVRAARILAGQAATGTRPPNAIPIFFNWTGSYHRETTHDV